MLSKCTWRLTAQFVEDVEPRVLNHLLPEGLSTHDLNSRRVSQFDDVDVLEMFRRAGLTRVSVRIIVRFGRRETMGCAAHISVRRCTPLPAGLVIASLLLVRSLVLSGAGLLAIAALGWSLRDVLTMPQNALSVVALSAIVALVISVSGHELGHLIAYRVIAGKDMMVLLVTSFASVRIVRDQRDRRTECLTAVAGPTLGFLASLILLVTPWYRSPANILVLAGVGGAHLLQLAVPMGDGRTLREAGLRRRDDEDGSSALMVKGGI